MAFKMRNKHYDKRQLLVDWRKIDCKLLITCCLTHNQNRIVLFLSVSRSANFTFSIRTYYDCAPMEDSGGCGIATIDSLNFYFYSSPTVFTRFSHVPFFGCQRQNRKCTQYRSEHRFFKYDLNHFKKNTENCMEFPMVTTLKSLIYFRLVISQTWATGRRWAKEHQMPELSSMIKSALRLNPSRRHLWSNRNRHRR